MFKKIFLLLFLLLFLSACSSEVQSNAQKTIKLSQEEQAGQQEPVDVVDETILPKKEEIIENLNDDSVEENKKIEEYYKVTRVVDGDTIDVDINGEIKRIRIIGVNTPETVDPRKPVECFGKEASDKAKEWLSNKEVKLEADSYQGDKDIYDRLLRYVWTKDGLFFNLEIIKQGYAYEYTYNLPYKYQGDFNKAEKYAKDNKLGLWVNGVCGDNIEEPVSVQPTQDTEPTVNETQNNNQETTKTEEVVEEPQSCTIKGNISYKNDEKIYHVEGCQSYSRTVIDESKGEKWFCTEAEALAAGWRKALNCP